MDILKWEIFRHGIFKQAKFLVTAPQRAQTAVVLSETGLVSKEIMPMSTGFITWASLKLSWLVIHKLKVQLKDNDEPVLLISERSYIPLDPYERLTASDRETLTDLKEIAKDRVKQKKMSIIEKADETARASFMKMAFSFILVLIGIIVISTFTGGC